MNNLRSAIGYVAALLLGAITAFFLVFNAIFSDVSDPSEHLVVFAMVLVVYGLLGLLFGFLVRSWLAGIVLSLPAILIVLWYSLREPGNLALHLAYVVVTVAASSLGAYAGARLSPRGRGLPV